jgi:hypothetical protein
MENKMSLKCQQTSNHPKDNTRFHETTNHNESPDTWIIWQGKTEIKWKNVKACA